MQALWLEDGRLSIRQADVPNLPSGEALVRVLQAGICNTDLELVDGYYPFAGVLGHEFVGRVERGPDDLVGKRVVGEINACCGQCPQCVDGRPRHCAQRTVLGIKGRHGAFAEYLALPVDNLHVVPETLSSDAATFAEPLAAAIRIQEQVAFAARTRVLVVGAGKLGQLIARSLLVAGCDLEALCRHPAAHERLRRHGVHTVETTGVKAGAFDVAIDCTGNSEGFDIARRALRPRGTLVIKSTYNSDLTLDVSALVVDEITVIGSRCGPFAPALDLLASGFEVADLIEARYPLADAIRAFEHAAQPGTLKVLVDIDPESTT